MKGLEQCVQTFRLWLSARDITLIRSNKVNPERQGESRTPYTGVIGQYVNNKWTDDGNNAIAFGRGKAGFFAMNNGAEALDVTFPSQPTLKTASTTTSLPQPATTQTTRGQAQRSRSRTARLPRRSMAKAPSRFLGQRDRGCRVRGRKHPPRPSPPV